MAYFITLLVGISLGAGGVLWLFWKWRKGVRDQQLSLESQVTDFRRREDALSADQDALRDEKESVSKHRIELESYAINYKELQDENLLLKHDLQNVDVTVRKLEMDQDVQDERQNEIVRRVDELGKRYLNENIKWISKNLTPNNYAACKSRLIDVIEKCRGVGFEISEDEESNLVAELKKEFENCVRAAFEREEQARIKAQIREEQKLQREFEKELKQLDRERQAIEVALEKALADAEDTHSEEIERLRERLLEAEERSKRAVSQAQLTKAGHVYVISNIGSFGKDVFKIGMTRRLDPADRISELGSASVPFPFDVHMMISSDNAPKLENALHHLLHKTRVNKAKPRKEFFRVEIEEIRAIVEEHHGEVNYVADPEALEYYQSMEMSEEDSDYIDSVYESLADSNDE